MSLLQSLTNFILIGDKEMDQASTLRKLTDKEQSNAPQNSTLTKQIIHTFAVTSGKGGVGKTNIVVNLAIILSRMKKKVLIIDADLGLANIDVLLGLTPKYNIFHLLEGQKKVTDILIDGPENIKILPASSGIQELSELKTDQKLMLLEALDTYALDFDYALIDTGAGISSNVMYFNSAAQDIIVVVSPEPTSITDSYALIKVLSQNYGHKKFRMITNNVSSAEEGRKVYSTLTNVTDHYLEVFIDFLGYILKDNNFPKSVQSQKPIVQSFPNSKASRCLNLIANELININNPPEDISNIGFFWKKLFNNNGL